MEGFIMLLINKNELVKALTVLARVAPVKGSTIQALRCARLQTVDRQTVCLSVSNLEEYFSCKIKVSDAPDGLDVLLPIAEVRAWLKGKNRSLLQVEPLVNGGVSLSELTGTQEVKKEFPAPMATEFPEMPQPCCLAVMPKDFIRTLNQIAPSVSTKDSRLALHGILLSKDGLVATDGKQLCHVPYSLPVTANMVLRVPSCLFTNEFYDQPVKFGVAKDNNCDRVMFEVGNYTLISKYIQATYPNWKQVVPKAEHITCKLKIADAAKLQDTIGTLPDDETHKLLVLRLNEEKLEISAYGQAALLYSCELASRFGRPAADMIIDRKFLLRVLSLGHDTLEQMSDRFAPMIASGGLGQLVFMPMHERNKPAEQPEPQEPTQNKEPIPMKTETNAPNPAPESPSGYKIVTPPDVYEELMSAVEELRNSVRSVNDQASNLVRKLRDNQSAFKKRDRELRAAREAIEKLKVAGF